MEQNQKLNTDTSIDPTKSYENGAWNNLKLIFQQQVPQYFISVEQGGGSRTIKDINGLLSFLESTINNSLNTFIKQSISISKLNKIEEPRVKRDINYTPTSQNSDEIPFEITNNNESKNMNKKQVIRLTESDLHRIVKESVKRALMENTYNTHQYQVVAYLIDPNADWQRGELSSDSYEESKRDFELLSNLDGNLNRQAMNIFRKYQINNGAVEEHDSEEPFMMDIDGDGIYLLKRID